MVGDTFGKLFMLVMPLVGQRQWTAKVVAAAVQSKLIRNISLDLVGLLKLCHSMRCIHWVVPLPNNSGIYQDTPGLLSND